MNVNVKLSLTDDERNTMFRRLTGKTTKGMVSRADVNQWVKDQLQTFLTLGSPTTETVNDRGSDQYANPDDNEDVIEEIDPDNIDVMELIQQNKLLQTRVNRLQYLIDTRGLK